MAYCRLDDNGKPVRRKGRIRSEPATRWERGVELFHYEIYISIAGSEGKKKQVRRRYWLENDVEAKAKERELRHEPPADAVTWQQAIERWKTDNRFSESHFKNADKTIAMWVDEFGERSTIEGTTLADFSKWFADMSKEGTGRAAQNRRAHMLAIARYARSVGLVKTIPFEHSPEPEDRMQKRPPAEAELFFRIADALPSSMEPMWRLLGVTGMRVSAACGLRDDDIANGRDFTVTTKGEKRVTYQIIPQVADIFSRAKAFKSAGWKKGRGKKKTTMPITTTHVFCNDRGNPWTKDTFNFKLQKILENKGLPHVTPHQLRHMAGTLMGESGLSEVVIQATLDHEEPETTAIYTDKTQKMRNTGLRTLANALANVEKMYILDKERALSGSDEGISIPTDSGPERFIPCPFILSIFNNFKDKGRNQ